MKKTEIKAREELYRLDQRLRKQEKKESDPAGTAGEAIDAHNNAKDSHGDIRQLVQQVEAKIPRIQEISLEDYNNLKEYDDDCYYVVLEEEQ